MKSLTKNKRVKPADKKGLKQTAMPLGVINYSMIALGVLVIAGSYAGMYLEKEVNGFFSLFIAPFALVSAYVGIAFAVLYRRKSAESNRNRSNK
ncbi:hypothetical protein [Chlorobium phaeobacteroides]|jgi:hypothetical protein|nr:hypothetical protein [Chlorobium phaeobacteroides]